MSDRFNAKEGVIITKCILDELYKHGATKEILPDLKTLAKYMKAEYHIVDGKEFVFADKKTIKNYFDLPKDHIEDSGESGSD